MSEITAPATIPTFVARPARIAVAGLVGLTPLVLLAAWDVAGAAGLWEHAHRTLSALLAVLVAGLAAREASGATRHIRILTTIGLAGYFAGALVQDVQVAPSLLLDPSPSDVWFLSSAVPIAAAVIFDARRGLMHGEAIAFAIDGTIALLAVALGVLVVLEPVGAGASPAVAAVLLAYPLVFVGLGVITIGSAIASRVRSDVRGPHTIGLGLMVIGLGWGAWLASAVTTPPRPGDPLGAASSVGVVLVAIGVAGWHADRRRVTRIRPRHSFLVSMMPVVAAASAALTIIAHGHANLVSGWHRIDVTGWAVIGLALVRQTLLLRERTGHLVAEQRAAEREQALRADVLRALEAETAMERRYRLAVSVHARLAQQLAHAPDDAQSFAAAAEAYQQLFPTASGEIARVRASDTALVVATAWGEGARATGAAIGTDRPSDCPSVRSAAPYVPDDPSDPSAVGCPVAPGTAAGSICVPMFATGKVVAIAHLAFGARPGEDDIGHATRVAEQTAMAIANARLMRELESQALTDPLTGLFNPRFFDPYVDQELAGAARDGRPIGLAMVDLDHFKRFNDRFGHPAGDEALRTFARAAMGAIRQQDALARYGGEEFLLLVRDGDLSATLEVAERVRTAVERQDVELGDGRRARMTVSIGVATTDGSGYDRHRLVGAADRALYTAKELGRNRVVAPAATPATDHRAGDPIDRTTGAA